MRRGKTTAICLALVPALALAVPEGTALQARAAMAEEVPIGEEEACAAERREETELAPEEGTQELPEVPEAPQEASAPAEESAAEATGPVEESTPEAPEATGESAVQAPAPAEESAVQAPMPAGESAGLLLEEAGTGKTEDRAPQEDALARSGRRVWQGSETILSGQVHYEDYSDESAEELREGTGWVEPEDAGTAEEELLLEEGAAPEDAGDEASQGGVLTRTVVASKRGSELKIYQYLTEALGLNTAAACGVLANISCESSFRLSALGDGGTSYGLCQWHAGRKTSLLRFLAGNGYSPDDLAGQLGYLREELLGGYRGVYDALLGVADTAEGAYEAARVFCVSFEKPAAMSRAARTRGNLASTTYWAAYAENRTQPAVLERAATEVATSLLADLKERAAFRKQWKAIRTAVMGSALIDDSADAEQAGETGETEPAAAEGGASESAANPLVPRGFFRMLPHL